jgi:outer membrane biogenesis lipoprotein LolB
MLHRVSRLVSLPAIACILLAGCASIGSQPAYVADPKPSAQNPCQSQTAQSAQGTNAKDPCKK